jgi:hypothetical protein
VSWSSANRTTTARTLAATHTKLPMATPGPPGGAAGAGHEPYPAVVVDRSWNLVDANAAVAVLLGPTDSELLAPPVNVLRVSLHPGEMAPRIVNLGEWRVHLFGRLRRQVALTGDAGLAELGHRVVLPRRPRDRGGPARPPGRCGARCRGRPVGWPPPGRGGGA